MAAMDGISTKRLGAGLKSFSVRLAARVSVNTYRRRAEKGPCRRWGRWGILNITILIQAAELFCSEIFMAHGPRRFDEVQVQRVLKRRVDVAEGIRVGDIFFNTYGGLIEIEVDVNTS